MAKLLVQCKVPWGKRSVEWRLLDAANFASQEPRNAMWAYTLDGITFIGFPFDPVETAMTTKARALNWLNRHHILAAF
jgi:hypothetical protein